MVEKIGRNNSCPCMSGKKYKKCCGKTGIWQNFKEQNVSYYDEAYFFNKLFSDERFRRVYQLDRIKINKPLLCFKADYPIMSEASYGSIEGEAYTILGKSSQPTIAESIHMAHEIEHLVLHSQGHKVVTHIDSIFNKQDRTHKFLNDMIYDPLINKRLIQFGYDIEEYLKLSDNLQIGLPNIEDHELLVKTLYVKRVQDYRNLNPNIKEDEIKFVKWVKKDYPQVVNDSKKIIRILDDYNLEIPTESEKALNEIIVFMGLERVLTTMDL